MTDALYSGVASMRAAEQRLDAIAANLANSGTAAYKRRSLSTQSFDVARGGRMNREVMTTERTDFSQGPLQRTGNSLDLALNGKGFFVVEGPQGEVLTRNGAFMVDEAGGLITREGYPVAWDGPRGRLDAVGDEVFVSETGEVRQGQTVVGDLRLEGVADEQLLQLTHDGYFQASASMERVPAEAEVHQGALEGSNTSSLDELVAMITVQRSFESATNTMQMIQRSYQRLLNLR
jgi:flagellar basal-body rod protein FlgF